MSIKFPLHLLDNLEYVVDAPVPVRQRRTSTQWDNKRGIAVTPDTWNADKLFCSTWPTKARAAAWYLDSNGDWYLAGFGKDRMKPVIVIKREDLDIE